MKKKLPLITYLAIGVLIGALFTFLGDDRYIMNSLDAVDYSTHFKVRVGEKISEMVELDRDKLSSLVVSHVKTPITSITKKSELEKYEEHELAVDLYNGDEFIATMQFLTVDEFPDNIYFSIEDVYYLTKPEDANLDYFYGFLPN